uniref:Staphylococcal nuclease domain-containing protein 1 n=1 Tax=Lepeophtheirus salmonis TaxID=72036 RepID=A0A0K2U0R1_LEPSM
MATEGEQKPKSYFRGIVKQVLDGGSIVIRGQPRNGPPPERTLALADIEAPRLARRPTINSPNATEDEPYAWEAREFLRKLLVGKSVLGTVNYTVPSGREYGVLLYGSDDPETATNAAVTLLSAGLVKIRDSCNDDVLKEAFNSAKTQGKGIHCETSPKEVVRQIVWDLEDPRRLVESLNGKSCQSVIEHVRDGSTIRAFITPPGSDTFHHVTLMLSGVRCPIVKIGSDGKMDPAASDAYALEAQYFTESRLLQREVLITLESVSNKNCVGSVVTPSGNNIAEALVKEGFAKCMEWSLKYVSSGPEKYRQAQADAKARKIRLWKDYTGPVIPEVSAKDKEFTGKVVEIVNGDALMVKKSKTETKKIHLASIRPPKLPESKGDKPRTGAFRPLYDIPFMFEAREFLRKKLIGQTVKVTVDYIQPENNDFPEKCCCTVKIGGVNVAEALVSKGFATVVRYSADNDQRSSHYDDLLAAEDKALKSNKGLHDKKNIPTRRISDLTGDSTKSKTFLPSFQRAGKISGVVEFVASGSRFRVYIPRESCVITFLLSGIQCPRAARNLPGSGQFNEEPFGNEALSFSKELTLQREVEIEVETVDKGGNFIGYMFCGGENMSLSLVEQGFAAAYSTAYNSSYGNAIFSAEDSAKKRKEKRWANYVEEVAKDTEEDKKDENEDRKVHFDNVAVTETTSDFKIFVQRTEDESKLSMLMKQLREEFITNPPLAGVYQPKKGDICAAKFVDDEWYRAQIEKVNPTSVNVIYIDFGNREANLPKTSCTVLPASFTSLPSFAKEYSLALCLPPPDEDYAAICASFMKEDLLDKIFKLNIEYKIGGASYVTLTDPQSDKDMGMSYVAEGLMLVDRKGGRRLAKLVKSYQEAQESAKKKHINMWEYGDITADDAKEFGLGK